MIIKCHKPILASIGYKMYSIIWPERMAIPNKKIVWEKIKIYKNEKKVVFSLRLIDVMVITMIRGLNMGVISIYAVINQIKVKNMVE
jgi:hypothetical protein